MTRIARKQRPESGNRRNSVASQLGHLPRMGYRHSSDILVRIYTSWQASEYEQFCLVNAEVFLHAPDCIVSNSSLCPLSLQWKQTFPKNALHPIFSQATFICTPSIDPEHRPALWRPSPTPHPPPYILMPIVALLIFQ